jgi:hypothetical protein
VGEQLASVRAASRRPLCYVARKSQGRFTTATLRDAEAGLLPLDAVTVADLAWGTVLTATVAFLSYQVSSRIL